MPNKAIAFAASIMLAAMLPSCGFGGAGATPPVGTAQVTSASNWGMPGGNPANTRLSANHGPASPELQWAALSEYGTSSPAVVTPDGTVVVGLGNAVLAFNTDGTVRWRRPATRAVAEVFTNGSGMVAFKFDPNTIHLVSPDGGLLQEYRGFQHSTHLIGVGNGGTLFTAENGSLADTLTATSVDGEVAWQLEVENIWSTGALVLADGNLAFIDGWSELVVLDPQGSEQWRVTYSNWAAHGLIQAGSGEIYVWGQDLDTVEVGYSAYLPTGTWLDSTNLEFTEYSLSGFRLGSATPGGATVWIRDGTGLLLAFNHAGELLWRHEAQLRSFGFTQGLAGEVYALFETDNPEISQYNLLGFDSTGGIILSLVYESNTRNAPVVDQLGRVCFGTHEGFFAFNQDTEMAWGYDPGGTIGSVAVGMDGTVYSTAGNILYATTPTGIELWRYASPEDLGVVLVGPGGSIFTHTNDAVIELTPLGTQSRIAFFLDEGSLGISMDTVGNLYAAGSTGVVRAFQPGMELSWEHQAAGAVTTRIAIGADGGLYFSCNDGRLYALDASGQPRWDFDMLSFQTNTPVVVGDSIYATSVKGGLFKIAHDGTLIWRYQPQDYCYSSPSIGPDGTVYFGTDDYLAPRTTVPELPPPPTFSFASRQTSQFGIAVDNDSVLLDLNGSGEGLYAVSAEGALLWNLHSNYGINHEVAVDAGGSVYLSVRGQLFSLNPDGTERWRTHNFYRFSSPPVIGNNGSILLGTANMLASFGPGN